MSSRVPSSLGSPLRRHRYSKTLPSTYSHQLAEEEEREVRQIVADMDAAVNGPRINFGLGGRTLARLVRARGRIFYLAAFEFRLCRCHFSGITILLRF